MSMTRAAQARTVTLGLLATLLTLMATETILFAPSGMKSQAIMVVIAIKIIPPGLFFWPISRNQATSAVWLGILLLPYFCWAILGAMLPGTEGAMAVLRAFITAGCFVSAMFYARWQKAASAQ